MVGMSDDVGRMLDFTRAVAEPFYDELADRYHLLFDDWWVNSRYEASGYDDIFYHDVHPDLAAEYSDSHRSVPCVRCPAGDSRGWSRLTR